MSDARTTEDAAQAPGDAVTHDLAWLVRTLAADGVAVSHYQSELLAMYVELLAAHNASVNLISRKDGAEVWRNHILHSLAPLAVAPLDPALSYIDLGTGGGLPGIPLAIMMPGTQFTLVDSIAKKMRAVQDMTDALGLPNVFCVCGRAEELVRTRALAVPADAALARAVAPVEDLVRWSREVLAPGAGRTLLAWKGGDLAAEIESARTHAAVSSVEEIRIAFSEESYFVREQKELLRVVFDV